MPARPSPNANASPRTASAGGSGSQILRYGGWTYKRYPGMLSAASGGAAIITCGARDRDTDKTDRCPRALGEYTYIESETMKKWIKPAYSDLRFGFEVTMYIQHR